MSSEQRKMSKGGKKKSAWRQHVNIRNGNGQEYWTCLFGGCGPYKKFSEVRVIGHYTCDHMRAATCGIGMCKSLAVPDNIYTYTYVLYPGTQSHVKNPKSREKPHRQALALVTELRY